jgi:hypothetical protein
LLTASITSYQFGGRGDAGGREARHERGREAARARLRNFILCMLVCAWRGGGGGINAKEN